jgi:monoamine oxidase
MSRTSSMHGLKRIMSAALYAERQGLRSADALGILKQRAAAQIRARQLTLPASRRTFLKGIGAATLIGGALAAPRPARAVQPSSSSARIAVVGAGMGGLACAYALQAKGVLADVYEANTRVGGRILSVGGAYPSAASFPGQVSELGGEFLDTLHGTMKGYANEFGFQLEDVLKEAPGEVLYYINGQLYSEEAVVDEFRDFVDAMHDDLVQLSSEVTPDSYTAFDAQIDNMNLDQYLITRDASPLIRDLIREAYRNEYGCDVSQQSTLNYLFFIHADKRSKWTPWGVFSDERYHVLGGNQQIPDAIAGALGSQMHLDHRLEDARKLSDGSYRLTFTQTNGPLVEVDYDYVVFALPFTVLRTLSLDASLNLPAWKTQVIDTLQYGTNSKMLLGFQGQPWAEAGSSGSMFSYGLANVNSGWESNPANASGSYAIYADYSGGARGANMNESDPAGEAELWLAGFDQVVPGSAARVRRDAQGNPVAVVKNWSQDPSNLGAYTCNQPGYFTTMANTEGTRVDNLLFAGEHCNSWYEFQGWMEGAALSGNLAASEILADLRAP